MRPISACSACWGCPPISGCFCGTEPADAVFVSGAAGAVARRPARSRRSRAARWSRRGSPDKVRGHDAAGSTPRSRYRDYKGRRPRHRAAWRAPDGIDMLRQCQGDHLEAALQSMKDFSRIVLCRSISRYNDATPPAGPFALRGHAQRLTLRGFIVSDHRDFTSSSSARWAGGCGTRGRGGDGGRGLDNAPGPSPGSSPAPIPARYRADRARPRARDLGSHGGIMALPWTASRSSVQAEPRRPFCAEILAHMGADVVKVERPGAGDDARGWGPPSGMAPPRRFTR